jgi:hypothetical protein
MIVRRTRLIGAQAELWPDWRYFPFLTNRTEEITIVESEHRQHAVVELTIRDLKDQALAHFPSGQFAANSAWTVIACIAHNLARWTTVIGLPDQTIRAAHTLRRRLLSIPGRLTRTARQWTLHLPARWPWQHDFIRALARIRALPWHSTNRSSATPTTSRPRRRHRRAYRHTKTTQTRSHGDLRRPLTPQHQPTPPTTTRNERSAADDTVKRWIQA